jgi:hypothetical protein
MIQQSHYWVYPKELLKRLLYYSYYGIIDKSIGYRHNLGAQGWI